MDQEYNNFEDEQDYLRFENELKKIKLSLEKGAVFSNPYNEHNLSPEIENKFLKNIEAFEEAHDNAKHIPVYEFIGKPDYLKADVIPDYKISHALENIMQILNNNDIVLETLCETNERVLYKFITEELFFHEIDDIRIKGMVSHFIYEEFHPNHEYDIRNHCTDFICSFLDKSSGFYTTFLTEEAQKDSQLMYFRDSFGSFSLNHFNISSVSYNEQIANVSFTIDFSATIENSYEIQHISGEGTIELHFFYDFWCIHKVNFPEK